MSISRKDVEHVARLAHLELTPDEVERFTRELGSILDYVARLDALETEGVDPAELAEGVSGLLRADEVEPGLGPGEATEPAPGAQGDLFKVPPAFGEG